MLFVCGPLCLEQFYNVDGVQVSLAHVVEVPFHYLPDLCEASERSQELLGIPSMSSTLWVIYWCCRALMMLTISLLERCSHSVNDLNISRIMFSLTLHILPDLETH